jgi:hypothetical protein
VFDSDLDVDALKGITEAYKEVTGEIKEYDGKEPYQKFLAIVGQILENAGYLP